MKRIILLLAMVLALGVGGAALPGNGGPTKANAVVSVNEDGGGGTNTYCGVSTIEKRIWTYAPTYGWHYYICKQITTNYGAVTFDYCTGCTSPALWFYYTGYYHPIEVLAWVPG